MRIQDLENYNVETSGAFVDTFRLEPPNKGILDNLNFAVKDNIHVKGYRTSYGSKPWREAHPIEVNNAICVEQLLNAGATCLGKTVSDEYTCSLDGESYFYGTPINPRAPDCIPGGSSSGSASVVACGLVDVALGTDNAGSVRVPASLCGIWGMRPTTHRISEAGVLPFVPSVSTVGVLANTIENLSKTMQVLLSSDLKGYGVISKIYFLEDAFNIACNEVNCALRPIVSKLKAIGIPTENIRLSDMLGFDMSLFQTNEEALRLVQAAETWNSIGTWVKTNKPEMGTRIQMTLQNFEEINRVKLNDAYMRYETVYKKLKHFIKESELICYPTIPVITPFKNQLNTFEQAMEFYQPTMAVTSFAGIGRLPEITMPLAQYDNLPIGLSLVAGTYQDEFLLNAALNLVHTLEL